MDKLTAIIVSELALYPAQVSHISNIKSMCETVGDDAAPEIAISWGTSYV